MTTDDVIIAPGCIRKRLEGEYKQLGGYKPVAQQYGVSAAMIWQILNKGYVPKTHKMQKKLGYVPTCPRCGYEFDEG